MSALVDETIQDESLDTEAVDIQSHDEDDDLKPIHTLKTDIKRLAQFISKVERRIEKYHRQIARESHLGDETLDLVKQGLSDLEDNRKRIFDA